MSALFAVESSARALVSLVYVDGLLPTSETFDLSPGDVVCAGEEAPKRVSVQTDSEMCIVTVYRDGKEVGRVVCAAREQIDWLPVWGNVWSKS